jgi:hypothetical protein
LRFNNEAAKPHKIVTRSKICAEKTQQFTERACHHCHEAIIQPACMVVKKINLLEAPVAQLDRASDYESEGRTFESFRARHFPTRCVAHFNQANLTRTGIYFASHTAGLSIPLASAMKAQYSAFIGSSLPFSDVAASGSVTSHGSSPCVFE